MAAPGVLGNDYDSGGYALTAHLQSQPSDGTVTLNGDGSFTYTANPDFTGSDTFAYFDTDTQNNQSYPTSVTLNVNYGVISAVDSTKLAADTIHVSRQILGNSNGAPGTAQNLSLVYDSVAGQPDQVIEGDFELSNPPPSDTLTATLTFNGVQQPSVYYSTDGLSGTPTIHVADQASTVNLATGRYPYSLTLSGTTMAGTSTINGFANVVNNSASPVGLGWDIPGVYHLYQNNVPGVPAGVLLTPGDGTGWYFTQAGGNYTSPNGTYAFDTLTSVNGGSWQLVDK
ncbi:MAG: Ig-like domain-containing protein, partial [Candidatus Saccharimonadales bacterium]